MNSQDEARTKITCEFGSCKTPDPKSHGVQLHTPHHIKLYKIGLRRSPRLKQKAKQTAKQKKAHVTFVRRLPKLVVPLLTLLCTVINKVSMPAHQTSPTASFTERSMSRLHELNELYNGTLNELHTFAFSTLDISSNEWYTYHKAIQQPDVKLFVEAMQNKIHAHKSRKHREIVERSSLPLGTKTIQAIWSFKQKWYPNGRLNKHKPEIHNLGDKSTKVSDQFYIIVSHSHIIYWVKEQTFCLSIPVAEGAYEKNILWLPEPAPITLTCKYPSDFFKSKIVPAFSSGWRRLFR